MEYPFNQSLGGRPSRSPALSSPSTRGMDHLRMTTSGIPKNEFMPPSMNSQRSPMTQLQSAAPPMLTDFVAAERAGPWNQYVLLPEDGSQAPVMNQANFPTFYNYRNPPTLSVASDSGYASVHKRYPDEVSSLGENPFDPERHPILNTEVHSISNRFGTVDLELPHASGPEPPVVSLPSTDASMTVAKAGFKCSVCGKVLRTKSFLKYVGAGASSNSGLKLTFECRKHNQQHTRPFRCVEPGCNRVDGFSTQNDLDRHNRSLHKNSSSAIGKHYKCTVGHCVDTDKIWPRADNFRNHLIHVHSMSKEEISQRNYLDCRFLYFPVQAGAPPEGNPPASAPRPTRENGSDLLQGICGGPEHPPNFPNSLPNWAVGGYSALPADSSAVPGSGPTMADLEEELQLDPEGVVVQSSIASQPSRHADISRQVQETLSYLPHSRPASALGNIDGRREAQPFQAPPRDARQVEGAVEATSVVESQLTYQNATQKQTTNPNFTALDEEQMNTKSTTAMDFPPHQQPEMPAEFKPDPACSEELETTATMSIDTDGQTGDMGLPEDGAQNEEEMMKLLEGFPPEILSKFVKQKGIRLNTESDCDRDRDRDRDSDGSSTSQKHHCTLCDRKFKRKSELKYVQLLLAHLAAKASLITHYLTEVVADFKQQAHASPRQTLRLHVPWVCQELWQQE